MCYTHACFCQSVIAMQRILLDGRTIQDRFPGIGRYVYNLIDALAPCFDGEVVTLVNPGLPNTRYDLDRLARHRNVHLHPTDIPTFHWREQTDLPRLIRSLRPDLAHLPYNVRPYRLGLPNLLTLFDAIPRRFPACYPRRTRWPIELLQRLAIRSASAFVAISAATARDFQQLYRIPPDRITLTPLAADPVFGPQPAETIADLRRRLALPDRYVLYLGSNQPHKNLPALLDAWALLTAQAPRPLLVIAGAWDIHHPEAMHQGARLGAAVRFLSDVPASDLPGLYAGAEYFVFPSLYEGFGLPVLEAMACGTPVACSNVSSLPEVAGDAALLFDPGQPQAIAAALDRLLADPDLRSDLSQRGLRQAATFSWQNTAAATLAAYRRLAAGSRAAPG